MRGLATGVTDMRRGINTLALQVQEDLGRDPQLPLSGPGQMLANVISSGAERMIRLSEAFR